MLQSISVRLPVFYVCLSLLLRASWTDLRDCPEFCAFISQFNQQFCDFCCVAFFFSYLFFYVNFTLCVYIYSRMKTFSLASSCTFVAFIFVRLSSAANQSNYVCLYNNQINARALIGQSAVGYCYYKPTEKSRDFSIII